MSVEEQSAEFKQIGEFIRKRRKELNISLEQLGKEVGVSAAAISRYELGQRSLSWTMCDKIMQALGMEIGDGVMIYLNELAGNTLDNYLDSSQNNELEGKAAPNGQNDILAEFNSFERYIEGLGYRVMLEGEQYYLIRGKQRRPITVEELRGLVRRSYAVLEAVLSDFMDEVGTDTTQDK